MSMYYPDREEFVKYSYILAGFVALMGVFKLMSYNEVGILDGIFTAGMGILLFFVARTTSQGRAMGLPISAFIALSSLVYSLWQWRTGNLFFTLVGMVFCVWLVRFKRQGELQ